MKLVHICVTILFTAYLIPRIDGGHQWGIVKKRDGGWIEWRSWGPCSHTCDEGTRMRTRVCASPKPQLGGNNCEGAEEEDTGCNIAQCPGNCVEQIVVKCTVHTDICMRYL